MANIRELTESPFPCLFRSSLFLNQSSSKQTMKYQHISNQVHVHLACQLSCICFLRDADAFPCYKESSRQGGAVPAWRTGSSITVAVLAVENASPLLVGFNPSQKYYTGMGKVTSYLWNCMKLPYDWGNYPRVPGFWPKNNFNIVHR